MSYLEQLKRDAERGREQRNAREAAEQRLEGIYREQIGPRLLAIHQFLFDLTAQLEDAGWQIDVDYRFPGVGQVVLHQSSYRLNIDSTEKPQEVVFSVQSIAPTPRRYACDPDREADLRHFLSLQRVKHAMWTDRQAQGKRVTIVEARLSVTSVIRFRADIPNEAIELETLDFSAPGVERWRFGADEKMDSAWLDNLAGFLLHKTTVLTPRPEPRGLSDLEREKLQARLEDARRRQEVIQSESDPQIESEPGVLGRAHALLRRVLQRR